MRPASAPWVGPAPWTSAPTRTASPSTSASRESPPARWPSVREAWRIDDEWWRRPISRDYRAVVLDDGRPVTLYHDLLDGRWYAQKGD